MKLALDTVAQTLVIERDDQSAETLPLYSREAFEVISREWVRVGWNQKYPYTFSWMGRPIIQLPEDMIRLQEVIHEVQPDVIIETGVAHGGSLVYYASLCKVLGKGRVIGVDIVIRPHNRTAIEAHPLASMISLVIGDSEDPKTVAEVRSLIKPGETVLVILDSCHSKSHVSHELECYSPLVTEGSYIVATDGIMHDLSDVPRGVSTWDWDNPMDAAAEFAASHPEFVLGQPKWPFNESELKENVTHWPGAWLKKVSAASS